MRTYCSGSGRGVTIIEVLVASVIFLVMSGGMWTILRSTRQVADLSQAKDEAKGLAETVLKHLQQDISTSKADVDKKVIVDDKPKATPSFSAAGNTIRMKVPKPGVAAKMDADYVDVIYTLAGQELSRQDGNSATKRVLCRNVTKLVASTLSDSQVEVEIEVSILPPGSQTSVTHNQRVLVTIREAITNAVDSRWLTSDEVSSY